jgi:hypothetical protein
MSQRNRRFDKNNGNGFGRLRTNSTPRSRVNHDASRATPSHNRRSGPPEAPLFLFLMRLGKKLQGIAAEELQEQLKNTWAAD